MKTKKEIKIHADAHKDMLIQEVNRMLKESEDLELIQLIYMLLLKSNK